MAADWKFGVVVICVDVGGRKAPALRRGRCLHRPQSFRRPQPLRRRARTPGLPRLILCGLPAAAMRRADENHRPLRSTTRQAPALHRPAELPAGRKVPRRAKSPALHGEANGRRNREPNIRGNVYFPGAHLRGIVGRAFTPAAVTSGCPGLPGPMPLCPAKLPAIAAFPGR